MPIHILMSFTFAKNVRKTLICVKILLHHFNVTAQKTNGK